jgi:hypothetical protein
MIRVFCYVSDPYLWCLKPFSYLFCTYWSELQEVIVGGFTPPQFPLPKNFHFHQISKKPYPKEMWSDGLIRFLNDYPDDIFVLMLEDYLLRRTVDCAGVSTLAQYMRLGNNNDVVRFDLTADRLYGKGMHDIEPWGHYDIIACDKDAMYEMSLQTAIWNRRNLLTLLRPGMNPWEVETQTDMQKQPYRVLGTRQNPVRYANLMLKGEVMDYELEHIPEPHRSAIEQWIRR